MYVDIVVGLMIGWGAILVSGQYNLWLVFFGMFATLAPDLDFIVYMIRKKGKIDQYAHEHRDLLHKPFLVTIGGALLFALTDPFYGMIWFLGTLWHFVHDTFDGGWGIRWLYPFYFGYFTLASHSPVHHIRTIEEQRALATSGDPQWFWSGYLKWNKTRIIEYVILGCVSVVFLLWYIYY
jgi:hypothetical protein